MEFGLQKASKKWTVPKRWEATTEQKSCFHCLADSHRGRSVFFRSSVCRLNGCTSHHHRMLHEDRGDNKTSLNDSIIRQDLSRAALGGTAEEGEPTKRTHMTTTTMKLTVSSELTTASQMEVGCLRHPGASTIGSQLLDGDHSHGWQILATQP